MTSVGVGEANCFKVRHITLRDREKVFALRGKGVVGEISRWGASVGLALCFRDHGERAQAVP